MKSIRHVNNFALVALIIATNIFGLSKVNAQEKGRDVSQYNLQRGLGLKGYDPVSYFVEGGGQPALGIESYRLEYMGVTYLFSSAAHLDLFVENPEKYEPTYGGWCAYAMASGSKVDIKPLIYTINGNRLHFFVSNRAKSNFDVDVAGHEARADGFWKQISGEDPRK
ncbi:MAG: YHS domain-containing (seleno)protein [Bdellovibrionales bacterium]